MGLEDNIKKYAVWARVELGMSSNEFNRLTPAELPALIEQWRKREERLDVRMARLCWVVAVSAGTKQSNGSDIPPDFFMPGYVKKKKVRKGDVIQQLMNSFGGTIIDTRKPRTIKSNGK